MVGGGEGGEGPAICDPGSELLLKGSASSARIINGMEKQTYVIQGSLPGSA